MATIGIFDSGTGGLSVFREIFRIFPGENYLYWSDNAFCPYGDKPREFIIDRARAITDFMLENGADIIVVACNTATAAAINVLRAEYPVKFIGMEPAVKPAAAITRTGVRPRLRGARRERGNIRPAGRGRCVRQPAAPS